MLPYLVFCFVGFQFKDLGPGDKIMMTVDKDGSRSGNRV